MYAPYVRLTVYFHFQHGQDGRPLRSSLRATQILATDSFKREGNRTKRSGHYNLSPRQGYRHRKKEYRQLIFLHVREFYSTLSEVVSRSLLYTMPTETPLRRTLSNTIASEGSQNLLPPCLFAFWQHGTHCTLVYRRIVSIIAEKQQQPYSRTLFWLRCKLSFSRLRSAIMCLRGARSSFHHPAGPSLT